MMCLVANSPAPSGSKLTALEDPYRSSFSLHTKHSSQDLRGGSVVKNLPSKAGDMGLIAGLGHRLPAVVALAEFSITQYRKPKCFLQSLLWGFDFCFCAALGGPYSPENIS